jgi:8-oxo-dGTP diphosphatase
MDTPSAVQRGAAKAIIARDGKFLLLQTAREGGWELPGGMIEAGESPEGALRRELKEEIGVSDVEIEGLVDVVSVSTDFNGQSTQVLVVVYACRLGPVEIKLSAEHTNFKWVDRDEFKVAPLFPAYKPAVAQYLALVG